MKKFADSIDWNKTPIPVVQGPNLRGNVQTVMASIPVGFLMAHGIEIPYHDYKAEEGYQRQPSLARINKLKASLLKGKVDLPTAVLLNLRDVSFNDVLLKRGDQLFLKEKIKNKVPFYIVDGQHRILALKDLFEETPNKWGVREIPCVLMIGATKAQEMEQFYIVNTNAKSVRTDLALVLLKQMALKDGSLMTSLVERSEDWKVTGETIVEELAKKSPLWKDKIRFPNEAKNLTTITSSSMVVSLRHLLNSSFFKSVELEDQLIILNAFWEGVREILPAAFDEDEFTEFAIQKNMGVAVLHGILAIVLEHIRSADQSVTNKKAYVKILSGPLEALEGENANQKIVQGADFWRIAPLGAAGQYSSSAGQKVLMSTIQRKLPPMRIK